MALFRQSGNLFIMVVILLLAACSSGPERAKVANPASVYCVEQGGRLESRTDANGGEYAMCYLPDAIVCEEWALFRKECP